MVGYLILQVGPGVVWSAFRTLSWRLLLVLVFPTCVAVVLDTLGWRFAFLHAPPHSLPHLLGVRLAGEAVNLGTPTASVGGEPIKALLLRPRVPLREGLASVIVDKTTVISGQLFLLVAGLTVGALLLPISSPLIVTMAGFLAVEVVCVTGFILVQMAGVVGGGGRLLAKINLAPTQHRQATLDGLDETLRSLYATRRGRLVVSMFCHFLAFAVGTLEIYLVVRLLGLSISVPAALAIGAFGSAVKFLSFMVPASLGALEGANVVIFAAFGLGGAVGLTYTLVRRFREIVWIATGFAILSLFSSRPAPSGDPPAGA